MFLLCRLVYLCLFFVKQKTAYEMRISDWSSDVCSSDLLPSSSRSTVGNTFSPGRFLSVRIADLFSAVDWLLLTKILLLVMRTTSNRVRAVVDRKSVVEGKSVSVGVDLGGRRIIKKKKKKEVAYLQELSKNNR